MTFAVLKSVALVSAWQPYVSGMALWMLSGTVTPQVPPTPTSM